MGGGQTWFWFPLKRCIVNFVIQTNANKQQIGDIDKTPQIEIQ